MSSSFKITLRYINYEQALLWSSLIGTVSLFIINQFFSGAKLRLQSLAYKNLLSSALMGFFNPFLYYLILFKAYELLEAQIAGTLNYIWPLVLVIMSALFLKQKIKPISYIAIFISFCGIIIISSGGSLTNYKNTDLTGIILAVSSSVIWATYWILNMKDKREETGKITMNLFFGFIFILTYMLVRSKPLIIPNGVALLGVIYIGLFEMSITFVIWLYALKKSSNTAKVSNLIYLSPFIALVFIRLAVKEQIHVSTIIGLATIIAGIVLQQFSGSENEIKE